MRNLRLVAAFAVLAIPAAACTEAPPQVGAAEDADRVRRYAAILDYVAADYGAAVQDGKVVDAAEYEEQLAFLADAAKLGEKIAEASAGPDLVAPVAALRTLVDAKAPAETVAREARALRRRALAAHGIVIAPAAPPSLDRGAELYATNCVRCHGATGGGDGIEAANLNPKPRSFRDPAVMADLFPARAFSTLTDGVPDTGMASFGTLSAADRWSLSFYVFTLRHDPAAVARGEQSFQRAKRAVAATPSRLAGLSDGEIAALLASAGLDEAARADAVAWLRAKAPYRADGAPLDPARALLSAGLERYRAGDVERARELVAQAYLDGFDPYEGALRSRDGSLVTTIEARFLALRERIASEAPADRIERDALSLAALLDRAEESLGGGGAAVRADSAAGFASALFIVLREGIEAALLILLLLGLARRTAGATAAGEGESIRRDGRAIHAGWIGAGLLGVVFWFASGALVDLGGGHREIIEGVVSLVAALVLLWAGHFVLARLDAARRVEAIKRRIAGAASGSRRRVVLFGLAFLAVFREMFEVVLFLRTVALDAPAGAVAGGVAAGGVILVLAVVLLGRLGRRVKPAPLLAGMGTLLCALAVILAGKGVHALQAADLLPIRTLPFRPVEWIGLYPTWQGVAAQAAVLLAFAGIAAVALIRARAARARHADETPAAEPTA